MLSLKLPPTLKTFLLCFLPRRFLWIIHWFAYLLVCVCVGNMYTLKCVCKCTYVCICACTCVHMHVEVTGQPWMLFLRSQLPYFFRQGLSLGPGAHPLGWLANKLQGSTCPTSCAGIISSASLTALSPGPSNP